MPTLETDDSQCIIRHLTLRTFAEVKFQKGHLGWQDLAWSQKAAQAALQHWRTHASSQSGTKSTLKSQLDSMRIITSQSQTSASNLCHFLKGDVPGLDIRY